MPEIDLTDEVKMSDSMRDVPESRRIRIADRCPACGAQSLFVGEGGWLTCSVIGCKEPGVSRAIEEMRERSALTAKGLNADLREAVVRLSLGQPERATDAVIAALKRLEAHR